MTHKTAKKRTSVSLFGVFGTDLFEYENPPAAGTYAEHRAGSSILTRVLSIVIFVLLGLYVVQSIVLFGDNRVITEASSELDSGQEVFLPNFCFRYLKPTFNESLRHVGFVNFSILAPPQVFGVLGATGQQIQVPVTLTTHNGNTNVWCADMEWLRMPADINYIFINTSVCSHSETTTCADNAAILEVLDHLVVSVSVLSWMQSIVFPITPPPLVQWGTIYYRVVKETTSPSFLRIAGERTSYLLETDGSVSSALFNNDSSTLQGQLVSGLYIEATELMTKRTIRYQSLQDLVGTWAAFFGALMWSSIFFGTYNKRRYFERNENYAKWVTEEADDIEDENADDHLARPVIQEPYAI